MSVGTQKYGDFMKMTMNGELEEDYMIPHKKLKLMAIWLLSQEG